MLARPLMQKHFSLFLFFRQRVKLNFGEVNNIFFRKHFKVYGYPKMCGGSVTTKISQCHQSQGFNEVGLTEGGGRGCAGTGCANSS